MKLRQIRDILDLDIKYLPNETYLDEEYSDAFASDLMSDALYLVNNESGSTILLTGLANSQSIRTAEMLDITIIIYVRDKKPSEEMLELAKDKNIVLATYRHTMFKACGLLYSNGIKEAS